MQDDNTDVGNEVGRNNLTFDSPEERREFWMAVVQEQLESGLSAYAFCKQQDLAPSSFHHWKQKLKKKSKADDEPETHGVSGEKIVPKNKTELAPRFAEAQQRREILQRFADVFGYENIHCLMADREFIGKKWFLWLQQKRIPYVVRLRNNFRVMASGGRQTQVCNLFRNLKIREERCLGEKREVEPIKRKKHGRMERSIFGRGLDELLSYFSGCASNLRRVAQVCFGIIYRGLKTS